MMGRTGKLFSIIMAALFVCGLVLVSGCDEARDNTPPPPKPKLVSKQIAQPEKAVPKQNATVGQQPADLAVKNEGDQKPLPKKAEGADGRTSVSGVTEDKVKQEQAGAMALEGEDQASAEGPPLFHSQEKYDFKGRVDPFVPLLNEKRAGDVPAKGENGVAVPKRILTPLEKMELSQIKLVAVIQTSQGNIAMVEEASGKGYEVRVGTYMGRNGGRVEAIHPDGLAIKEYYTDYQGKPRERVQELKFHRNEGGE